MTLVPSTLKPVATGSATRPAGHLLPLDGLRGIAILAVLMNHLLSVNFDGYGRLYKVLGLVVTWGQAGVDLFFVLSGFLITGILMDAAGQEHFFKNFYMRRVLRIMPLYYGLLLLLALCTPLLHIQWHGIFVPMMLYLGNMQRYKELSLPQNMGNAVGLSHLWSLAVEEQFYLVWPWLVALTRSRRSLLLMSLAGGAVALCFRLLCIGVLHDTYLTHFSTLGRADTLLDGAVLAVLYRSAHWPVILRWSRAVCLCMATFFVISLCLPQLAMFRSLYWTEGFRYSVLAVTASALLAWALRPSLTSRVCSTPLLRLFGRYSYGLYVLHLVLLSSFNVHLRPALLRLTSSKLLAVLGTAGVAFIFSCAAAWLSFRYYEAPFLRLKRYFSYGRRTGAQQPSGSAPVRLFFAASRH